MPKTLYLLDGMALAYRAHFALIRSPIFTSKGFNTSAIFGYTATLIELIKNRDPSYIAVAFDTSAPTERHLIYPEYKANREDMPEELKAALPHVRRITEAFGIPVIIMDGYEADDIIGTLAKRAEADDFDETFMVTPDKDFGQLVTDKIKMYRPSRQGEGAEILGISEIKEKWGISSVEQVIDMLGLSGDVSDNIPGIPGIGPKTAQKLIEKYSSIEILITKTDELKGKQQERVREFADQALLSKKLATIKIDVPIELSWDDLKLSLPDRDALMPILAEFEFRTLGKRLFGSTYIDQTQVDDLVLSSGENDNRDSKNTGNQQMDLLPEIQFKRLTDTPHDYRIVNTPEDRLKLADILNNAGGFVFDTETTHLNPRKARLVGISFSTKAGNGWYVPVSEEESDRREMLKPFIPIFANEQIEKTGHNLKFDLSILAEQGVPVMGTCFDTLLAHALVDSDKRHNLDILAEDYLQYSTIRFNEILPNVKKGVEIDYSEVDPNVLADYACEDADISGQLRGLFEPELEKKGQSKVFYEIETPLLPVLVAMELEGIRIDTEALSESSRIMADQIVKLKEIVYELAGREFNLNSPKQLGEILFDELKIVEKPKKTRTGQYATNEQVLTSLENKHPIVSNILEYRGLVKLKGTYVDALPNSIDPVTDRVHTNFGQMQTSTGRLSSNDPNLQNIPIRTAQGREIRKAFIPRESWLLLSADYSQIELRILASLSDDAGMLEAFAEGCDIHSATAAKLFGTAPEDVTREQRRTAKMVNFGIPYGISAFGLAQRLGNISRSEANLIIDNYFKQFPGIPGYMDRIKKNASKRGYVETITGRRRYISDINSSNATVRAAAERNAINMPIQGTAADMIKIAMVRIHNILQEQKLNSRMLLQVHDELVFDLDPAEEPMLRDIVKEGMQNALKLKCPIEVDMGTGENWLEAH